MTSDGQALKHQCEVHQGDEYREPLVNRFGPPGRHEFDPVAVFENLRNDTRAAIETGR